MYLIGSYLLSYQKKKPETGLYLFMIGSMLIFISQLWKLMRMSKNRNGDNSGYYKESFFAAGAFVYMLRPYLTATVRDNPSYLGIAAMIFSFGGLFYFVSACYIQKRYFWEKKIYTESQLGST